MHGRKPAALDHVGYVAAQVGIDDLRAGNAENRAKLVGLHVANLEDAGLLGLDHENGFVANARVDSRRDADFVHAVAHRRGIDPELDIDAGLFGIEQNGR